VYAGFTVASLIILVALASIQTAPGYMDAEYYYGMGLRIANIQGFSEPFLWNYLSDVDSIPHPGFTYWMPMPALISAAGIWISGLHSFVGGKVIHVLLGALIPGLAVAVTHQLTKDKTAAALAGLLALFPVFYNAFLVTTDSFGIIMILGGVFYLLTRRREKVSHLLGLGIVSGLIHLSRADGLLWLLAGIYITISGREKRVKGTLSVVAGYLVIMASWFARNYVNLGQLMPAGLSSTFWLSEYNDIFIFSTSELTVQNWLSLGLNTILSNYLDAGLSNLSTAILVQGQIILMPLICVGAWKHRRDRGIQAAFLVWIGIFLVMSVVFPFAGMRGGFLHSSAAFQTLVWGLAASGFFVVIEWGVQRRNWEKSKAGFVFGGLLVVMIAIAAFFVFADRVIGGDIENPVWNQSQSQAKQVAMCLEGYSLTEDELVMINNPPGYFVASGSSSIVIPNGGVDEVLTAAEKYGAQLLVLEVNHPRGLRDLFNEPESEERLTYLETCSGALIFRLPGGMDEE
jgi:hypothetical protein